ncbi:glyoxylase-like metal-dependent hydrolase (beta-lactamase superfamily II) [Halorubrum trapanicum]|uniref:Glyoxylase-like metal-dependent hydrolase (Beta-lactamase superfamily II) n=1 Tax=Halorubrum trapanicum TaxID=29284 RepID=A0A8J7RT22_9EURY|nr:MBL fold metallo-hydrolase [Halorubrum trapanicum]MBP1900370.1 glyoxylase-like metal-dependent hydrolase (beta-lactamase superfamily II) [Halorubrum trapanicum]
MATEITDGVWRFDCRGVNAYLVSDDVPTLVDAGTPWDEETIRRGLDEAGVEVPAIGRILLTHYDLDHVGTLAALAPELDASVRAYGFDAELLRGTRSPPLRNHKGLIQRLGGLLTDFPDLDVVGVRDGETLGSFTAYHTPGHTPGHVAYVSEELGVGLLGDLVSESDGELEPSGWLISYDTDAVATSVRGLAARAPPYEVACVGHGEPLAAGGSEALRRLAATL